jgi:ethanolamine ammonia-lyase small subunit
MDDIGRIAPDASPEILRARTPARIFVGRAGAGYKTRTILELRCDHAFARDAVETELHLEHFDAGFVQRFRLFEVCTQALTKAVYLARPDLGRLLNNAGREAIEQLCPPRVDLQIAIGDGLSASAVLEQVPSLLPAMFALAEVRHWRIGRPFLIRNCRVGVLNDLGDLIDPKVAVLLIGERPGLATTESLSAYLSFQPRAGHDDSRRNLISNIHARGVPVDVAARRIASLTDLLMQSGTSGVSIKEIPSASLAIDFHQDGSLLSPPGVS